MTLFPSGRPLLLGLALALLSTLGCDEDWKTYEVDIHSLAAADSVAEGLPLPVQFGYYANGEDQFSSYTWDAIDDSTIRLRVFQRVRRNGPALGAPAFATSSRIELPDPPARAFRIVAGDLRLEIQGGAAPSSENRLTVRILENGQPLPGVQLRLDQLTADSVPNTVLLPPTDAEGRTVVADACLAANGNFRLDASGGQFLAFADGRWPPDCATPLTLVMRGRTLQISAKR